MKTFNKMALAIGLAVLTTTTVVAEPKNEINIFHTGSTAKKHDRKIEAAAIKIVANKMGDLRGLIDGFDTNMISAEQDLLKDRSSSLGFPSISEPRSSNPYPKKEVIPLG